MPEVDTFVFREDSGLMGRVYAMSEEPDWFGRTYKVFEVLWSNGLRTTVHENNLVETELGWVVRAI